MWLNLFFKISPTYNFLELIYQLMQGPLVLKKKKRQSDVNISQSFSQKEK